MPSCAEDHHFSKKTYILAKATKLIRGAKRGNYLSFVKRCLLQTHYSLTKLDSMS